DGKGEKVIDHALAVARRFKAHIEVLHSHPKPEDLVPFAVFPMVSVRRQLTASAAKAATVEGARVRKLFAKYLKAKKVPIIDKPTGKGVSASWRDVMGSQSATVALYGRLADLIVVPQPDGNIGINTFEAALLETGKPVLMAPPAPVKTIGRHVAVGWNGATEAAKALSSALPILEAADKVMVFSAPVSTETRLDVGAALEYLRRHGIKAAAKTMSVKATQVGDALLEGARNVDADVLLIGAFGQSRGRELVFGGVTQHIIDTAKMPVILVH
ncbi:MAG: universal stress protein, partial [Rhodospirillales bacterium]|nr:universal stress protein [Rhodospirillales bacterium]